MEWIVLLLAGLFEVGWATGLKWSDGLTRFWPAVVTVCAMIISFVLLAQAVRAIPLGTAYVVWTGIGAVGSVIAGVWLFGESINAIRIFWLTLIVVGILGLQTTG